MMFNASGISIYIAYAKMSPLLDIYTFMQLAFLICMLDA